LTLLACFSTDEELGRHPQLTQKIPVFIEALSDSTLDEGQVSDVLQCISAQMSSPQGRLQLVKCGVLEALGQSYVLGRPDCLSVLVHLISVDWAGDNWSVFSEHFLQLMAILATSFASNQDAFKFDLLEALIAILSSVRTDQGVCTFSCEKCLGWLKLVATGLRDILQSRVDATKQQAAIHLAALLTQQFSLKWALLSATDVSKKSSFLCLLIQLVSVELHMALDGLELEKVFSQCDVLTLCFVLMEHCVMLIASSTQETGENDLSEEALLQLHTSLREGLNYVVQFLLEVKQKELSLDTLTNQPLVLAAIRVLGAWLTEDTLSLSEDVHKVLPFLVQLSNYHPKEKKVIWEGRDVLQFILPGLCQLISEDRPRTVLLEAKFHAVLQEYLSWLHMMSSDQESSLVDVCGQCLLACSVLQTICICDWALVRKDNVFLDILEVVCCLLQLENIGLNLELCVNLAFLAVLIIRRRGSVEAAGIQKHEPLVTIILDAVMRCVECCIADKPQVKQLWSVVSEPSLLLLQEITALVKCDAVFKSTASGATGIVSKLRTVVECSSGVQAEDARSYVAEFLACL
jgi:hypothetical protein